MSRVLGFVPTPDSAEQVVAWSFALAGKDGEVELSCLDKRATGKTTEAVRAALAKRDATVTGECGHPQRCLASVHQHQSSRAGSLAATADHLPPVFCPAECAIGSQSVPIDPVEFVAQFDE